MMRAEYWRDLVRRWVLVEEGIGSPDFLKLERAGLLREAVAALTSDGEDGAPLSPETEKHRIGGELLPRLNKSGGSDVRRDAMQCTDQNDDGAPCRRSVCAHSATTLCCVHAGHDPARETWAPLVNKGGGSDVEGGDANCAHDWRPYFAHLVCVKCGAAQRGAAGG